MVRRAPYDKDRDFDIVLENFIKKFVKEKVTEKDDDVLVLCVGETGTGKSMLMLHAYECYAGQEADISCVSFDRESFADNSHDVPSNFRRGVRFIGYDEANVSKRDATSSFNKALLDLYYAIRGLNIFSWWNNPSLDMIDKPFIKDRLTGLFFITTKSVDRPRIYYYFKKESLLQILEKYGDLDLRTLNKVKGKYSVYKGWFKDYSGFLKKHYSDKKENRMLEKFTNFKRLFGSKSNGLVDKKGNILYSASDISRISGYAIKTLSDYRYKEILPKDSYLYKNKNTVLYNDKALLALYDHMNKNARMKEVNPDFQEFVKDIMDKKGVSK